MFWVALMGMNYSMPCFHFTQCTLYWLLFFCLCTIYFTLLSEWFSFSLWHLVLTHTHVITEFWSTNLISYKSIIYSVAPSQYILLCLQLSRVYGGPISSASRTPHCHLSTMDVFCISKVFDCFYDNKNVFFYLTWLDLIIWCAFQYFDGYLRLQNIKLVVNSSASSVFKQAVPISTPWILFAIQCLAWNFRMYLPWLETVVKVISWKIWIVIMSSNENIFRVTATGGFHTQKPLTRSFDVFFDLRLNKCLSKRDASDLRRHPAHYDATVVI